MESVKVNSHAKVRAPLLASLIVLILLLGAAAGIAFLGNNTGNSVLTQDLSAPLGSATAAKIEINPGDGNLTIDRITGSDTVLASGSLQYLESQGLPTQSVVTNKGQTMLSLKSNGKGQPWFRLPWASCNGATEWQVHLNPSVPSEIAAHSDGGNVKINLAGMAVTRLSADTGGGNMDVILPDNAANLSAAATTGAGNVTVEIGSGITGSSTIQAKSGAGDVTVRVPNGVAARIHVTGGMGKTSVDSSFSKIDNNTYQSPSYDTAADKVEITVSSGAGNVSVNTH